MRTWERERALQRETEACAEALRLRGMAGGAAPGSQAAVVTCGWWSPHPSAHQAPYIYPASWGVRRGTQRRTDTSMLRERRIMMARHDQQKEWLHPRSTKRSGRWMHPLQRTTSSDAAARSCPERLAVCGGVLGERRSLPSRSMASGPGEPAPPSASGPRCGAEAGSAGRLAPAGRVEMGADGGGCPEGGAEGAPAAAAGWGASRVDGWAVAKTRRKRAVLCEEGDGVGTGRRRASSAPHRGGVAAARRGAACSAEGSVASCLAQWGAARLKEDVERPRAEDWSLVVGQTKGSPAAGPGAEVT